MSGIRLTVIDITDAEMPPSVSLNPRHNPVRSEDIGSEAGDSDRN